MFVRLAIEDDREAIREMARANMIATRPDLTFDDEMFDDAFHGYLTKADPTFFVVDKARDIIGFMTASIRMHRAARGHFTALEVIYVRSDMRGTRAAVLLTQHLVDWSLLIGACEIVGGNDNGYNSERTARFFEHFGFERVGIAVRRRLTDGK